MERLAGAVAAGACWARVAPAVGGVGEARRGVGGGLRRAGTERTGGEGRVTLVEANYILDAYDRRAEIVFGAVRQLLPPQVSVIRKELLDPLREAMADIVTQAISVQEHQSHWVYSVGEGGGV